MEIDVIERLGERHVAHPWGLQHLDAISVAQDARFPGPGAQGVGDFGRSPMGMHVDHGCLLHGVAGSVTLWPLAAKHYAVPAVVIELRRLDAASMAV
jgi:hypothetical protein